MVVPFMADSRKRRLEPRRSLREEGPASEASEDEGGLSLD